MQQLTYFTFYCFQTGAIIEDSQTARDRQPATETDASIKPESEKLEDVVGSEDRGSAAVAEEPEMKVNTEEKSQTELVIDKPTEAALDAITDTKTEPTEEVEVEEFYVKYKNL